MDVKIFTLKFSPVIEGFDDEALRRFISDKNVIEIRDQFFIKNHDPFWSVMVIYAPAVETDAAPRKAETYQSAGTGGDAAKKDYRDLLTDRSWPLFNRLREWRRERAMKDSVPSFVVFNNRQLAHIAVKAPESLNRLSEVEGVGKVKLEKYGQEVLAVVREITVPAEAPASPDESGIEGNGPPPTRDDPEKEPHSEP